MACSPLLTDKANIATDSRQNPHHLSVLPKLIRLRTGESMAVNKAPMSPSRRAHHLTAVAVMATLCSDADDMSRTALSRILSWVEVDISSNTELNVAKSPTPVVPIHSDMSLARIIEHRIPMACTPVKMLNAFTILADVESPVATVAYLFTHRSGLSFWVSFLTSKCRMVRLLSAASV